MTRIRTQGPNARRSPAATRLAVLIPAGPGSQAALTDTLESIEVFCIPERDVVVVNDSRAPIEAPGATVIQGVGSAGVHGGLYLNLSRGMLALLDRPWDLVLRMDTDALVTASGWERSAMDLFRADPRLATLGVTRHDYDGTRVDRSWPANQLRSLLKPFRWREDPRRTFTLMQLVVRALRNGYAMGESVLGGIAVYSRSGVEALAHRRLLGHPALARAPLSEDHLFGLALRAVGFGFADFGQIDDDLPMAAKWQGLPEAPEAILARGKGLVHSVKSFGPQDESYVRAAFAEARKREQQLRG